MQRVMDWQEQKLGAEHPETLSLMNTLAATYWSNRQLDQSIPLFEQTLQRMEKALGRDDSVTQATVANLGVNYRDDGRVAQSLPLLTEAYQASLKVPTLFWVGPQRLLALVQAGQTAPAIEMAKQLTAAAHAGNEPQSLALANQLLAISRATISLEGFSATLTNLEECLTILESQKPDDWPRFEALSLLGQELLQRQDLVAAEPLLEQGFAGLQARLPKMPPIRRTALPRTARQLVALYQRLERPEHVAKWQAVLDGLRDLE
jgi:tetratricopeptide (TPR) repeat protein